MTMPVASAQLVLARRDAEMAALKKEHKDLQRAHAELRDDNVILSRNVRDRVGSGLSSALTFGAALGGGIADGYLGATGSEKMGPFKLTGVIGLVAAIGSLFMPNADLAEGVSAVARGLAAGPTYQWGKEQGEAMARKRGQQAPPAPATPQQEPAKFTRQGGTPNP